MLAERQRPIASPGRRGPGCGGAASSTASAAPTKSSGSPTTSIAAGAQRQGVAQHEPRGDGAAPLVDLLREHRVDRGVAVDLRRRRRRRPARAVRRTRTVKRTWRPSPIGRGSHSRAAGTSSATSGFAVPNGASASSSSARVMPSSSPATTASTRCVGTRSSGRSTAAAWASNAARNASTSALRTWQPAAARCPPWRGEVLRARLQPAEQVERRDRAARAGARVAVERDEHARPVVALGDARGDDPDDARVPALAGEDVRSCARPASATMPSASKRMRCSTWRRSAFARSSSSAITRARSASSVSRSSTPASAR